MEPKTEKELAKLAYESYRESVGGRSLATGEHLPAFEDMGLRMTAAWIAAARAVATAVRSERYE
jgi:hypothetical protein